jgi:hypothetical protein
LDNVTVQSSFLALVSAQAAHSVEETYGRLYESFPPARFVAGLVSDDRHGAFVLLNILIVAFGLWCFLWPVRRGWSSAATIAWGWVIVETLNGIGHTLWSVYNLSYTPGLATAPLLILSAMMLARELRRTG